MHFRKLTQPTKKEFHRVGLISTLPRSSTWATRYTFATIEAILNESIFADPFSDFASRPGLNLDMLLIGHFYHPIFQTLADKSFVEKWENLFDPLPGTDWMSTELNILRTSRPSLFPADLPIVFVYREPFSMLQSYFNQLQKSHFFFEHPLRSSNGNIWKPDSYADFVINGGIQSYVKYRATFEAVAHLMPNKLLFIRYEDILKNRFACFRKMCDFLGCNWIKDEVINHALKLTEATALKDLEQRSNSTLSDAKGITEYCKKGISLHPREKLRSHFTNADESSKRLLSSKDRKFCEDLIDAFCNFNTDLR